MKSFYHSNESFASQSRPKYGSFTSRLREIRSHLTLLLVFLTAFSGNVWGGTITKTVISEYATANEWANATRYESVVLDANVTVTAGSGANNGKYYDGNAWRFYQSYSGSFTISVGSGYSLFAIAFTYTQSNSGTLIYNETSVSSKTPIYVSGSSITFSAGNTGVATNGQVNIKEIYVWYIPSDVSNTFARISSIEDLNDGDEIIFVNQAETYACGTTQNSDNRSAVAISTEDHAYSFSASDNAQVFVVRKNNESNYGFHTLFGYLYSGGAKASLKTDDVTLSTAPSGTNAWTNNGVTDCVFDLLNATNSGYHLAFNGTSAFSQYTSNIKPYIYKRLTTSDSFVDVMHDNEISKRYGSYSMPSIDDEEEGSMYEVEKHYKFVGWVAEDEIKADGTLKSGYTLYIPGESHTADGTTYYAIWATDL